MNQNNSKKGEKGRDRGIIPMNSLSCKARKDVRGLNRALLTKLGVGGCHGSFPCKGRPIIIVKECRNVIKRLSGCPICFFVLISCCAIISIMLQETLGPQTPMGS